MAPEMGTSTLPDASRDDSGDNCSNNEDAAPPAPALARAVSADAHRGRRTVAHPSSPPPLAFPPSGGEGATRPTFLGGGLVRGGNPRRRRASDAVPRQSQSLDLFGSFRRLSLDEQLKAKEEGEWSGEVLWGQYCCLELITHSAHMLCSHDMLISHRNCIRQRRRPDPSPTTKKSSNR